MKSAKTNAEKATLAGKRVLVTRAEKQSASLRQLLVLKGAHVDEIPFIEVHPPASWDGLDQSMRELLSFDWLILTSVNGVECFFKRAHELGISADEMQHLKIAAIGPATAKAIEDRGLVVDVVPTRYVAEEVVKALRSRTVGERVLLVRAKVARDVIPQQLAAAGAKVEVREAYQTLLPKGSQARLLTLLKDEHRRPHLITFTSSSTVENMLKMALGTEIPSLLSGIKFAAIGPITAATLRDYGLPVHIEAEEHTMAGLVRAIEKHYATG